MKHVYRVQDHERQHNHHCPRGPALLVALGARVAPLRVAHAAGVDANVRSRPRALGATVVLTNLGALRRYFFCCREDAHRRCRGGERDGQ